MEKAEMPEKNEKDRPLYFDEALRTLSLKEFARRQHTFLYRRPRHQPHTSRSR